MIEIKRNFRAIIWEILLYDKQKEDLTFCADDQSNETTGAAVSINPIGLYFLSIPKKNTVESSL